MEECQNIDLEPKDVVDPGAYEVTGPGGAETDVDINFGVNENVVLPDLHESAEPEQGKKNGRYNLRKSLAWDSAFFTSAGVLEPEELCSMLTGSNKSERNLLPGIEEDVTGSTESITTLASDHLTLESQEEDDLFVDIRASIQRSSRKSSNLTDSCSKSEATDVDSMAISSLKNEDFSSKTKTPKPGLKKTNSMLTVRVAKIQPKQSPGKLAAGKTIKQDSGRLQMKSMGKIGEKNPILPKPAKAVSRSNPTSTITTKQDSVGTGLAKPEIGSSKPVAGATVPNKGAQPPKVSVSSGARKALPKPAVSSKSSLPASLTTTKVQSTRSSISSNSSSSMSSGIPTKSSLMMPRRNPLKSCNVGTAPAGFIPKAPSKAASKNKPSSSGLSAHVMSTKISSSVSPASSISECSSASSSSSIAYQRSINSRTSLDTISCGSMDGGVVSLDTRDHSIDKTAGRNENQGITLPVKNPKRSSTQSGTLQAPMKPSGLRMPSPKIGFFDGVKSSVRTPRGSPQSESGLHTVPLKKGPAISSPARNSNSKLKSTKVPNARTVNSLGATKADSPKITSPKPLQENSRASTNNSCGSTDLKEPPGLSLEVEDAKTGESFQKVEAEDGVKSVVYAGAGASSTTKENFGDLNNETDIPKDMSTGDIKIASVELSCDSDPKYIDGTPGDVLVDQNPLQTNYEPTCEANKETGHAVNLGEGLIGQATKENIGDLNNETYIPKNMSTGDIKIASVELSRDSDPKYVDGTPGDALVDQDPLQTNYEPTCEANKDAGHVANLGEGIGQDRETDPNPHAVGPKHELLSDYISDCAIAFPATTASESPAARSPFAPKNSLDIERIDTSNDLAPQFPEKADLARPSSEQKENSHE